VFNGQQPVLRGFRLFHPTDLNVSACSDTPHPAINLALPATLNGAVVRAFRILDLDEFLLFPWLPVVRVIVV